MKERSRPMKISIDHRLDKGVPHIADVFHEADSDYNVDAAVAFAPEYGKPYFLVYAVHGSGDSFNPTKPQWVEIMDIFDAAENAAKLKNAVWEHNKRYEESHRLPYGYSSKSKKDRKEPMAFEEASSLDFQGKKYYTPWNGYFEALYEVDIKVVYFAGKRYKF